MREPVRPPPPTKAPLTGCPDRVHAKAFAFLTLIICGFVPKCTNLTCLYIKRFALNFLWAYSVFKRYANVLNRVED
ncbi:hypothetical protein FP572_09055 [Campylobacter fetus subsp. fetus]|nr:hypothetical protein FP572_08980 [Campylobacter fetus subsp. fetus]QDS05337.1 hypothetical protein FP572_09055 [Campylobacter fetus subsp. fetus]